MPPMQSAAPAARAATPARYAVQARHLRWLYRHPGLTLQGAVRLAITYANLTELIRYWVEQVPSDFGTAYRLTKIDADGRDAEVYDVCSDGANSLCCCLGFERH